MAQPIRRRIIEILASGEHSAGDIEGVIINEFGVGRSAVQRHLKLLREHGFVHVHDDDWPRHSYRLDDNFIGLLHHNANALLEKWRHRIGWRLATDPDVGFELTSRRGFRGRETDPDDPWLRHPDN